MKYSQGEWRACCLDNKPHFIFAGEDKTVCSIFHNDPNEPNCENMEGIVTKEESIANAKLIQSAPLLLEALQELVHLHGCEQEGLLSGQPTPKQWFDAVEIAEEVILKATE